MRRITPSLNRTALTLAAEYGYADIVGSLIATDGINVNQQDGDSSTALSLSVIAQRVFVVEVLLEDPGIQVDLKDNKRYTTLTDAARAGNSSIV